MASNDLGVWHQTSEQAVRERHHLPAYGTRHSGMTAATTFAASTTFSTSTAAAGSSLKRRHEESNAGSGMLPPPLRQQRQPPPAKRLVPASLPKLPKPLTASTIMDAAKPEDQGDKETSEPSRLVPGSSEYSQRRALSATPLPAADPLLSLAHPRYGLPPRLVANLAGLGIHAIYPWQKQCLLGGGGRLLDGTRNLVYAAPTGGGKSLVADVLLLRRVLEGGDVSATLDSQNSAGYRPRRRRHPKALLVLPFVALVQEKVRWLRQVVQGLGESDTAVPNSSSSQISNALRFSDGQGLRVVGFFGGAKIRAMWADFDIGVATIEKANALVNAAVDDCSISDLKVIVLDELHMVDDGHRGYLLELLATKLLCLDHHVQIVGMSATLTNIDLLARWLGAYSYETRYRPIPIEEHLVYDGSIYAVDISSRTSLDRDAEKDGEQKDGASSLQAGLRPLRTIQPSEHRELQDPVTNAVVALANETARAGFGALVFSSSRAASESDALLISRVMPGRGELDRQIWEARLDLLGDLQSSLSGGGLDSTLSQTILAGVGFHHAGMTAEERELVAGAYDRGVLKVCVATCGLAAGINLPARRVILHNARMGRDLVGPAMLRQMRGRAGRKGKDELGETYLCCRRADVDDVLDLVHAELPRVASCLLTKDDKGDKDNKEDGARRLQRALLEVVTVRLATSREALDDYVRKTLLYHTSGGGDGGDDPAKPPAGIWADVEASLAALQAMGFVEVDGFGGHHFQPTRLGKAVVAAALDPADALFVHGELQRALQAFVLDGEMHVLYTFTPVHYDGTGVNWRRFWEEMEALGESDMRALRLLGLKPDVISRMLRGGTLKETTPAERDVARVYRRFYLALQLRDLCNEMPVHRVARKYGAPRGAVQTLAQTCEGFAAGMIRFCEHMGWGAMASVLEHFVDRLKAGAKADLLALAKIVFVKSRTARVFWENGFKTVAAVANADPRELVPVLLQAQAGKVRLAETEEYGGEQRYREKLLAKAQIITESANRIWQIEMQKDLDEE